MRVYALYLVVTVLSIYAYRDWFKSLCGLIMLMGVLEHPDVPRSILDIQGLNPWNVLCANVLLGWVIGRMREGLVWDLPRGVAVLLVLYVGIFVVAFVRLTLHLDMIHHAPVAEVVSEYLINTVKWVIPGLLLYDGCRGRSRVILAIVSILTVYAVLGVQVIRWMPFRAAMEGDRLEARSRKIILNEIGYHRVNMSMLLAGASWATLSCTVLVRRRKYQVLIALGALLIFYAQLLTAGRMGYVTWAVLGLGLCLLRWRRYLLLVPVVAVIVLATFPGVVDRVLTGFGEKDVSGREVTDEEELTADRNILWPEVIEAISKAPVSGYGRLGIITSGVQKELKRETEELFGHPHNAYLEWLLDNGALALLVILSFYGLVMHHAMSLFRDSRSPIYVAVGGMALALVGALLVAGMSSQTFYPREGAVGMWATIGLMLRVYETRKRHDAGMAAFAANRPGQAPARFA